jgi:hypothetical protein
MAPDDNTAEKIAPTAIVPADEVRLDKWGRPLVGWAIDRSKSGRGPAKGAPNAGRPPDAWKATLRELASRENVLAHIQTVLDAGPDHPFFAKALEYVTEYGYGKATQHIEQSGGTTLEVIVRHE